MSAQPETSQFGLLEAIPPELRELPQWVCWALVPDEQGNPTKVPFSTRGSKAATDAPASWTTFDKAVAAADRLGMEGVGFVFSEDDPFAGIDLDHCRHPETGAIDDWALNYIRRLDSYTEVSPSGTGVHVIVRGELPPKGRKKGDVEMYDRRRFFSATGNHLRGTPLAVESRTEQILRMHAEVFRAGDDHPHQNEHVRPFGLSDEAIMRLARTAKNGEKFTQLFAGKWEAVGYASQSEADLALCSMLAFWCNRDSAVIDRLFRHSGLFRPKWDEPHFSDGETYGAHTVRRAIEMTTETFGHAAQGTFGAGAPSHPASVAVPPFPLDVLPEPLHRFVVQAAAATGTPSELVAVPLLALVGASAGKRCELVVKEGSWRENGGIWVAVVAPPGSAKSPALDLARVGIDAIQTQRNREFALRQEEHQAAKRAWESRPPKDRGEPPPPPEPLVHYLTSNATPEALVRMLASSDGIASINDELVGLFKSFDQYKAKGGNERQAYLSIWAGTRIKIDRVREAPLYVDHPVVSVVGGIQPDVLAPLVTGALSDGLMERFLFAYPDTPPATWSEEDVSEECRGTLICLFADLAQTKAQVRMSPDARAAWRSWYNDNSAIACASRGMLAGTAAKLPRQVLRIALILHLAEHGLDAGIEPLAVETLANAIEIGEYFRTMSGRVVALGGEVAPLTKAAGLEGRILGVFRRSFRRSDVPTTEGDLSSAMSSHTLSRDQIRRGLGGHVPTEDLLRVLDELLARGVLQPLKLTTNGRSAQAYTWRGETSERRKVCPSCGQVIDGEEVCSDCEEVLL